MKPKKKATSNTFSLYPQFRDKKQKHFVCCIILAQNMHQSTLLKITTLLSLTLLTTAQFPSDFETVQSNANTPPQLNHGDQWVLDNRPGDSRPIRVFYGKVDSLSQFHVAIPEGGCGVDGGTRQFTSLTAEENGCVYGTNGGFFNLVTGLCIGTVVVDGEVVQVDTWQRASLAVDEKQSRVMVGYFNSSTTEELTQGDDGISQFIQGLGWLVRRGKNYVNTSLDLDPNSAFTNEWVPRTAVGVDKFGSLWVVQADGQTGVDIGLNLYAFADLLVGKPFGLVEAINLDGAGSSTSVYDGKVVDYPTCNNTWKRCQRNVTSITCLKMN